MKFIPPHKIKAKPVKDFADIRTDANIIKDAIDKGNFPGLWKESFAISHAQISKKPYNFFVINSSIEKFFENNGRFFCNAKILAKNKPITYREACMSFPHRPLIRVRRYEQVKIECDIPTDKGLKKIIIELEGLEAFIAQHEIDHANGIDIYHK